MGVHNNALEDRSGDTHQADGETQELTAEQIVDILEEDIVFGYLHPRERLIEDDLRARFKATRHAVRQALADLEHMGLVERRKNIGALVKSYTKKEVMNLYAVREILETSGAQQIIMPVLQEGLDILIDIQRRHDEAIDTQNMRAAFRANIAFHQALFRLTDNPMLSSVIEDFARRAHVIRFLSMAVPHYLEKARSDHWKIIRALQSQDREALVNVCRDHILPSRDAYLAQYQTRNGQS